MALLYETSSYLVSRKRKRSHFTGVLAIHVPGLTHVKMLISSTTTSSGSVVGVNVTVTVSPKILGGGLNTGTSDVSCQRNYTNRNTSKMTLETF